MPHVLARSKGKSCQRITKFTSAVPSSPPFSPISWGLSGVQQCGILWLFPFPTSNQGHHTKNHTGGNQVPLPHSLSSKTFQTNQFALKAVGTLPKLLHFLVCLNLGWHKKGMGWGEVGWRGRRPDYYYLLIHFLLAFRQPESVCPFLKPAAQWKRYHSCYVGAGPAFVVLIHMDCQRLA